MILNFLPDSQNEKLKKKRFKIKITTNDYVNADGVLTVDKVGLSTE